MASIGSHHQEILKELKHKLLYTTFELQSARSVAKEEMRRNKENIKHLLQLLKVTCQERDEARYQLHKALESLDNLNIPTSPAQILPVLPNFQMEMSPPCLKITDVNSCFAESESHNYGSPQTDSYYEIGSSTDQSSTTLLADLSSMQSRNQVLDQEYNAIERHVLKKPLPQKGRLLKAVMEAGPLLHTLLVAGSLPQWRNPPPLQEIQIPFAPIQGCDSEKSMSQKFDLHPSFPFQSSLSSTFLP